MPFDWNSKYKDKILDQYKRTHTIDPSLMESSGVDILFIGQPGVGKSVFASIITKELFDEPRYDIEDDPDSEE